jgi:hypothetical protein
MPNATAVFFHCKHGDETRNTFISVARAVLAQILAQCPHLLAYLHEKASMSSDALLTSTPTAKEMIQTALGSCESVYVIIDGVDECGRDDRREITRFFADVAESVPATELGNIRCLLVSQNDGIVHDASRNLPSLTITNQNQEDLNNFASTWHKRIEAKFGELQLQTGYISNIISARAQGIRVKK